MNIGQDRGKRMEGRAAYRNQIQRNGFRPREEGAPMVIAGTRWRVSDHVLTTSGTRTRDEGTKQEENTTWLGIPKAAGTGGDTYPQGRGDMSGVCRLLRISKNRTGAYCQELNGQKGSYTGL